VRFTASVSTYIFKDVERSYTVGFIYTRENASELKIETINLQTGLPRQL